MADSNDYSIESLVAAQAHFIGRKLQWKYRVKWEGYDSSENTWEPAGNINASGGDDDVLDSFWNNASLDGRDHEDVKAWKHQDTVWLSDHLALKDPLCPKPRENPSRLQKRRISKPTPNDPVPSSSVKRKRANDAVMHESTSTYKRRRSTRLQPQPLDTLDNARTQNKPSLPIISDTEGDAPSTYTLSDEKVVSGPELRWSTFADEQLDIVGVGASSMNDGLSMSLKREKIEREIQAALSAVARLRMRGNDFKAVYRLPPEILAKIFAFHAPRNPPASRQRGISYHSDPTRRLGWIEVSHVCRRWRDTAIGTPSLWTDIPAHYLGSDWARTFLQRVQQDKATIPIYWQMDSSKQVISSSAQSLIREHLSRIQKLHLYLPSTAPGILWIQNLGNIARQLTSLHLQSSCNPPFTLPPTARLPLSAPLLNSFTLKGLSPHLAHASWTNLRNLKIADAQLHCSHFYAALSSTSQLEHLTLENITLLHSTQPSHRIALDALKGVAIRADHRSCIPLCRALDIPSTSSLTVVFEAPWLDSDAAVAAVGTVFSVIRKRLRYIQRHDWATHTVRFHEDHKGVLTIKSTDKTRVFRRRRHYNDLAGAVNCFEISGSLRPSTNNIQTVVPFLSLGQCLHLSVCSPQLWTDDIWAMVLPQATLVETLELSGSCAITLLKAVTASLTRDDELVLLPHLKSLDFNYVDFKDRAFKYKEQIPALLEPYLVERINHASLSPIEDICIRNCDVLTSMVNALEKIEGVKVDWDYEAGKLFSEDRAERWEDGEDFDDEFEGVPGYAGYPLW